MPCLIEPQQTVEVRTAVDGVIAAVPVERGDRVRRGQLLVELQSSAEQVALEAARFRAEMSAQIAVARSRLDYAERKASRTAELVKSGFASPQAQDEAAAERRLAASELAAAEEAQGLARIELRRAQEQLALRKVSSPLNGIVTDRLLNPGDLSDAGSGRRPVLRIAAIDVLKVNLVLPAARFGQVRIGQKAVVQPEVGGGRHEAMVRQVDRAIDAASGTFMARLELPNPGHLLPVGARCQADLVPAPAGPDRTAQ
ncbi:MAG: efflux RND transporter periplasmic adaptor subunit [Aquabacterium sp.]|nr:efflux RND transporter periplasmic adaptor subunit [Aquabacterium sp.]